MHICTNRRYLVDECKQDGGPKDVEAKTVVFCSPDKRNYRDFLKLIGSTIRYLPVWTLEEIEACRQLLYRDDPLRTKEKVADAFSKWGGVPRFVLEKLNDPAAQRALESAVAATDLTKLTAAVGCIDAAGDLSHKLLHIVVEKPYVDYYISFGTPHIAELVFEKLVSEQEQALELFLRKATIPLLADVRGILFEVFAHRRLSHGGVFTFRELLDSGGHGEERDITLSASRVHSIRTVSDISSCGDGEYCKPTISNFPVVDSVLLPDLLFQITVSQTDRVKLAPFEAILEQVPGDVVHLVFVVPPDVYDNFERQPFVSLAGTTRQKVPSFTKRVSQHALVLPLGGSVPRLPPRPVTPVQVSGVFGIGGWRIAAVSRVFPPGAKSFGGRMRQRRSPAPFPGDAAPMRLLFS